MMSFDKFVAYCVTLTFCLLLTVASAYNITAELGPLLSSKATIVFPGTSEFLVATDRDNEQAPPVFAVVVEVATENDVQQTVHICFYLVQYSLI